MSSIGIFDSGVGGVTVLKALREKFPDENFIYLADTARLPYGAKSISTIHQYLERAITFFSDFDLKAIVVACNSASVAYLSKPIKSQVPILNVIEPGASKAVQVSNSGRIGVLGTRATVLSEAYKKAIHKLKPEFEVFQQACPLLVPLVEEGWLEDPVTNLIVNRYISQLSTKNIDTLVLGCTHYPALRKSIANSAGSAIQLVDSAEVLTIQLEMIIKNSKTPKSAGIHIYASDFSPRLEETLHLLLKPHRYDSLETIDL